MTEERKPRIYIFPAHANPQGDCAYMAVAEDGDEVAFHISSCEGYGQHDMGLGGSDWKHDKYKAKYPNGYELEYVKDWKVHPFLSKQAEANKNAGRGQTELDSSRID